MAAELLSPDTPAPRLSRSWPTSFNSLQLEQLRQPLARVEHARLDRVLRDANDLGCLFYRFLVVVHEIDDLAMFRRKSCEALSQHCTLILLLQRGCGIIRRIFNCGCCLFAQLLVPSTPERRNRLEARDRQQPCRYRRAPFEPTSLTPHVEKYLADHVLRGSLIANETNDEPKHPHMVAGIQHLHGEPIAVRDSSDQHLVWCRMHFGLVTLVASDYHWVRLVIDVSDFEFRRWGRWFDLVLRWLKVKPVRGKPQTASTDQERLNPENGTQLAMPHTFNA